jgi:hypothetical protein
MKDWIKEYEQMPIAFPWAFSYIVKLLYPNEHGKITQETFDSGMPQVTRAIAQLVNDDPNRVARRIIDRYRTFAIEESRRMVHEMDAKNAKHMLRYQKATESFKPTLQQALEGMNTWLIENQDQVDQIVKANTRRLTGQDSL